MIGYRLLIDSLNSRLNTEKEASAAFRHMAFDLMKENEVHGKMYQSCDKRQQSLSKDLGKIKKTVKVLWWGLGIETIILITLVITK